MAERLGALFALRQHVPERVFWQKADVLGEHGEQAAHEEHRHVFRRMSLRLQRLRHGREAFGDGAGHLGRFARWVERQRIAPDRSYERARLRLAQVFEIDAERAPVGKLVVGFPVAAKIGVDLEAMADVADDDERRRFVVLRQEAHIILRLPARVEHQHVPGALGAAPPARLRLAAEQVDRAGNRLVAARPLARLLGFEDKAIALVEVDAPIGDAAVAPGLLDHALEHVIVGFLLPRRIGRGNAERGAKLGQEHRVVGPLLTALAALPAGDESPDRRPARRTGSNARLPPAPHGATIRLVGAQAQCALAAGRRHATIYGMNICLTSRMIGDIILFSGNTLARRRGLPLVDAIVLILRRAASGETRGGGREAPRGAKTHLTP